MRAPLLEELMRIIIGSFLLLLATAVPAHAYLNPGTGSLLLQSMIGIAATAWLTVNLNFSRLKKRFRALFRYRDNADRRAEGDSESRERDI